MSADTQRMSPKRQRIWAKSGGVCWYCGDPLAQGWHVDHMEPLRGGYDGFRQERDIETNMVPACPSCNVQKGPRNVEQFRHKIAHFVDSLNARHTQYVVAKRYGLIAETGAAVTFWFERSEAE